MPEIKGLSSQIVDDLVKKSNQIGQGRSVGTVGFINKDNIIDQRSKIIEGGSSGIPFRKMLSELCNKEDLSLLEMINLLPDNSVIISTKPGKTGIIFNTSGVNVFDLPVVKIGVKHNKEAGTGVLYPQKNIFNLASESEKAQLKSLTAMNMKEEKEAIRKSIKIHLKFLEISKELKQINIERKICQLQQKKKNNYFIKRIENINSIDERFALKLVKKSIDVEQGREIAAFGRVNKNGHIEQAGEIVVGGMGYIPSRLLASAYKDIEGISLRQAYTEIIPDECVIVHTHPGGTGVMHINDAMAGPGTWGRSIIAIGHNKKGEIKGANIIKPSAELFALADEKEELDQKFFDTKTSEEEIKLRKRRYQIAEEFTGLCQELEIINGGNNNG